MHNKSSNDNLEINHKQLQSENYKVHYYGYKMHDFY